MSWAGAFQYDIGKYAGDSASFQQPAEVSGALDERPVLICFSHLRWHFVYQRPQHLMSRFARDYHVMFIEEPLPSASGEAWLEVRLAREGVEVIIPRIPDGCSPQQTIMHQKSLLDRHLLGTPPNPVLWYYTPMSLPFSEHLEGSLVVYDCMDELSAFHGAPPELIQRERQLIERADIVFTGGYSLYEAKRKLHGNVHPFPSSVDIKHFLMAREPQMPPADQAEVPRPRLGFYGVLDERLDINLVGEIADLRPDWQLVMIGPVVKIDPAIMPRRPNIHYLGPKVYDDLPRYLAGWDVALMPFALNESTRFISPTKTPEYLAGGCPVVSTPITDVVRRYGDSGVVRIAHTAVEFVVAIEAALAERDDRARFLLRIDQVLEGMSWERTWAEMKEAMEEAM